MTELQFVCFHVSLVAMMYLVFMGIMITGRRICNAIRESKEQKP